MWDVTRLISKLLKINFLKSAKMKILKKRTFKKLKEVENEKEYLIGKLSELHSMIDSFKFENCLLIEKAISLENELEIFKTHLQKFCSDMFVKFSETFW
jgi:hypothetical protein